jgi:hypothetical protein
MVAVILRDPKGFILLLIAALYGTFIWYWHKSPERVQKMVKAYNRQRILFHRKPEDEEESTRQFKKLGLYQIVFCIFLVVCSVFIVLLASPS